MPVHVNVVGKPQEWPLLHWTSDEALAARLVSEGSIGVYAGSMSDSAMLYTMPSAVNAKSLWVAPGKPYIAVSFHTKTPSRPASAAVWRMPVTAPATGTPAVAAASLDADMCRVNCSTSLMGGVLAELSTASSSDSY
jgi:uncharacterized protein with WD repeat